jgi:hypothetical protein
MTSICFGILMFEDHCLGRCMLEEFARQNLVPSLVIEERSKLGKKRTGYYDRLFSTGYPSLPRTKEFIDKSEGKIGHVVVENINDDAAHEAAKAAGVDLFLLGGARIIKDHMLETSTHGAVNCHPGLLPWVKGSLPIAQSIIRGIPVANACHRVSNVLDEGTLIDIAFVDHSKCENNLEALTVETCFMGARQVCDVIRAISDTGNVPVFEPLSNDEGKCFNWDDNIEEAARAVLAQPGYVPPTYESPEQMNKALQQS